MFNVKNRSFLFNVASVFFAGFVILSASFFVDNRENSVSSSSCSDFNGQPSSCTGTSGCSLETTSCGVYSGDSNACNNVPGCLYGTFSCSAFSGQGSNVCTSGAIGCTYPANLGNCNTYNGNQNGCTAVTGCGYESASCSIYNGNSGTCAGTLGCSYPGNTGSCSAFSGQGSSACTSGGAGCAYPANLGICSGIGGGSGGCNAVIGCSYSDTYSDCSVFNNNSGSCNANVGCSYTPNTPGNCGDFSNVSSCTSVSGCTANYGNGCTNFNGDEGSCNANVGCTWDGNDSTCSGNYFSTCSGTYDAGGTCSGSYVSGGTCSGNYDDGSCTGSYDDGSCTGSYYTGICGGSYDDGSCTGTYNYCGGNYQTGNCVGTYDNTAPTVTTASSNKDPGTYTIGEVIHIQVDFSEAVTSTGNVTVTLDTGGTCTFTVSNNTSGACDYTVGSSQTSADLDVSSITGTVKDAALNTMTTPATPTSNLAANEAIVIDTTSPISFTTGSVITTDGTVVASTWNASNTEVDVTVPVANDASLTGGTIQLRAEADGSFVNLGSAYTILVGDLNANKTISINAATLEAITGFSEGDTITFNAIITDLAGNSTTGTVGATGLFVDQTAPTITTVTSSGTGPGAYNEGDIIDIDVTFSEAVTSTGNVTVTLDTGGSCTFTVSNSDTGTCDYTVGSGENSSDLTVSSITGTVRDAASNALVTPATPTSNLAANEAIVIDTTAPTVSITAPTNGATVGGASVSITANASDTNLAGVQFKRATNTNIGSEDTTSTYGVTWDTIALPNGSQSLIAVARDIAGNYATSTAITVTVNNDTDAPSISAGSPSTQQPAGTTQVTLSVTTDENATCRYGTTPNTAYGSISNTFNTTGGTTHTQTVTGLTDGTTYLYYVRCTDGTNTNSSDYTITFDIEAPTVVEEEEQGSVSAGSYSQTNNNTNTNLIENIRQKLVSTILSLIARLQEQLNSQTNTPASDNNPQDTNITFNINLEYPVTHPDVLKLQQFLNNNNFPVSLTGAGSKDNETDYFGLQTQSALIQFQKANNITPAIGFFGEVTRAKVNGY